MLKHQIIVDRLSELQKIQILTDVRVLADPEYRQLGIPEFKFSHLKGYRRDFYPSLAAMANSWNLKLISAYAEETAVNMSAENINVVTVPGPIPKLNLTNEAISEDPLLSSRIVSAYMASIKSKGMGVILDGAYLDEHSVTRLDKIPDAKFVNEFVLRPLREATANEKCNGIIAGADIDVKNYEQINTKVLKSVTAGGASKSLNVLCKNIPQEETVSRIVNGYICLDGSETVLKAAVDRYKRLKKGINEGRVSTYELDAEIENGTAFPPEQIDKAVDRVISFVFDVVSQYHGRIPSNPLNYGFQKILAEQSVVLLKNTKKFLPMKNAAKKSTPVSLVGDIIINYDGAAAPLPNRLGEVISYANAQGLNIQSFCRGYSMGEGRSDTLLSEFHAALKDVSTVVLFMGRNPQDEKNISKTENLYLPANQLAALDRIHSMGKKIIAVVSSDHTFDVSFAERVDALLVAPLNTKLGIEAVIDIISGKVSPSGKLAYSLYEDTDRVLLKQRYYLDMPQTKVGTFIGYRYYDSAEYNVAYPFGFGLSYSNFVYSGLSVQGNNVIFTVKNAGKIAAAEIPQVYIGVGNITSNHPKKELAGFEKIFLQPGASTTVTVPISHFETFDSGSGKWVFEHRKYKIYVGSSLTDIRLTTSVEFGRDIVSPPKDELFNYLQSETNIISDKYTLEADYKLMKKNVRNIAFGIGSLILAIAIFAFSLISGVVGIFMIIVSAILAIAGAIFFVLEGSDRKKLHEQQREAINEANKNHFKNAETITNYSAEAVFANEFDKRGKQANNEAAPARAKAANYLEFVNDALTYEVATQQFMSFALSKGYKFEEQTIRDIFSAMSASRLIITRGISNDMFTVIIKLLSEYFETNMHIDIVDDTYVNDGNALLKKEANVIRRTALMNTLIEAQNQRSKVHIAALTEVKLAELSNYFVPFARYIRNPRNGGVLQAVDHNNRQIRVGLTENVWFVLNLGANETMANIPAYISELASFIKIEYAPAVSVALAEPIIPFSYYQFDYLLEGVKSQYGGLTEDVWKKIDSIEAFVNNSVAYSMGNRICIAVERYFTVYRACGGEEKEAIDKVLAARVIPSAIVALDTVEENEQKNLSEKLDMVFGEENVDASRFVIRSSGTSVL